MDEKTVDDAIEIGKAGSEALAHLTDIFNKLAGPLAEELGLMFADKARVYRVRNWVRTQKRIEKMLSDAGRAPQPIPPRLFLPMLEAASLEDEGSLQEYWAALMSNASSGTISPAFIETVKQLTPYEAQLLRKLYEISNIPASLQIYIPDLKVKGDCEPGELLVRQMDAPLTDFPDDDRARGFAFANFERLGLIRPIYNVKRSVFESPWPRQEHVTRYRFVFTVFGVEFMRACTAPQPVA